MAWENDYAAYRAYGPAFGASGGAAYGYDVFTKSTTRPVVPERYFKELVQKVSYHTDHGDGMDVYDVGPTLGGGATAPLGRDGNLIFPGRFPSGRSSTTGHSAPLSSLCIIMAEARKPVSSPLMRVLRLITPSAALRDLMPTR